METKIINNRLVKIWASSVDAKAMQQIENLTTLPFLFHHLAIMPDVHAGMGMPIRHGAPYGTSTRMLLTQGA